MVIVVIPSHTAEEASGPPIVRISQRLIDGLEQRHLLIEPTNPHAFLIIAGHRELGRVTPPLPTLALPLHSFLGGLDCLRPYHGEAVW